MGCLFEHTPIPPRWWQWPTVLSLDAPVVVMVWQWLFATIDGVPIRAAQVFVVGTSVWLAYAADRWFEGWRLAPEAIRTTRHRFYREHSLAVAIVWGAVLVTDVLVAIFELKPRELGAGTLLLVPTLMYLLSHQLLHRHHPWRVPKELCVAVLIAGGASIFVVANPQADIRRLVIPILLFAGLGFANVALIGAWEKEVDEAHGQISLARQFRHASQGSRILPVIILAVAVATNLLGRDSTIMVSGCIAASSLLLVAVDLFEPRFGWQLARVLADAALLTPVVLWILRFLR